jgi:ATP-dependent helicase/nuclease subunit A
MPLDPAPAMDDTAKRIIERLTAKYAHDDLAALEAARSVTDWTKTGRDAITGGGRIVRFEQTLAHPRCLMGLDEMTAADKGTATHLVLQHLDFANACADLEAEIARMLADHRITQAQAKAVDRASIQWFIKTDLGQSLCDPAADVRRELSFNFAIDPSEVSKARLVDPADQVMVRGRIDLLLVERDGISVIDYKTDRVTKETLSERIEFYAPQVELYKRAMERITGKRVNCVCLVFLAIREIVKM